MPRQPDAPDMHGVLVVAKPAGPTSHDVVALVRRLAQTRRIGHGGTLDPFASGVLPLFLGGATRLVEYHLGDDKTYRATVCFGATSTTDDLDGELTPVDGAAAPDRETTWSARSTAFVGPQLQRPPAYSAIQVGGRRAYAMARAGEAVELPPRQRADPSPRARRVGRSGPGAPDRRRRRHLLRRHLRPGAGTRPGRAPRHRRPTSARSSAPASGPFALDGALSLDAIRAAAAAAGPDGIRELLLPPDTGLDAIPAVTLTTEEIADANQGRFVRPTAGAARRA